LGIAVGLNDLVENVIVLVNGTPEPMFAAAYGNHHPVQMPDILSQGPLSAQLPGISRSKLRPHLRIIPRSSSTSSTILRLKGNRKYSQTARAMICGGKRWLL